MASVALVYIETTIPEGMTAAEYRASLPRTPRWWKRAARYLQRGRFTNLS